MLTHPSLWGIEPPLLWFPPVGLGLTLLAWLSWPGLAVTLASLLLVTGLSAREGLGLPGLLEPVVTTCELALGWVCYRHFAQGDRRLRDPWSAILFLLLVPFLILCLGALGRTWLPLPDEYFWSLISFWSSRALGVLVLTPLLLVLATPWLADQGLVDPEPLESREEETLPGVVEHPWTWGDSLEIVGLVLSAGLMGTLLAWSHRVHAQVNWHLWAILVILVIWASLRQGLRGGCLTASAGALLALMTGGAPLEPAPFLALQGNLLALCSVALLVGASTAWIRINEQRYRQLIGQLPVVLYSARFLGPGENGGAPRAQVTLVSPACRQVFGCPPHGLLGDYRGWLERIHPADRELVLAALAQLARQQQPVICEYRLNPNLLPARLPTPETRRSLSPLPLAPGTLPRPVAGEGECWVRDTLAPNYTSDGQLVGWEGVVQEITEQRALASSLRRTTNMLHALVAHLPAGVFFVQGGMGQPVLVNARARQLLGQREDHAASITHLPQVYRLHKPDGTLYPWEELPVYKALHRGLTTMRDDIIVHRPDGRRIPLVTWAAPIDLSASGAPEAAVWVFEDLTALHQAEAARLESEARLRAVIETMAEGLIVQDQRGVIIECNPAACSILGVSAEELLSRERLGPETGCLREDGSPFPHDEHPYAVSLRTRQPVRNVMLGLPLADPSLAEYGMRCADSDEQSRREPEDPSFQLPLRTPQSSLHTREVRWILLNSMPLLNTLPGRVEQHLRVVSTFTDVTAYRQALNIVRLSEEKYRGLMESLPVVVLQLNRTPRVTYCNPLALRWLDTAALEATGSDLWERLVQVEDLPTLLELQERVSQGETVRAELRFRAAGEEERFGFTVLSPLWHEKAVTGSTLIILDTTLQRRMEQEMGRVQRLELIGSVASGVVHDFNNLLTAILNFSYVAEKNLPADHIVAQDLRTIQNATQEAVQLAGQLLSLSRQRRTQLRPIILDRVVERTLELLRSSFSNKVEFDISLQTARRCVLADDGQLQQILMNLCLNARDAMPEGGRLRIETACVADIPETVAAAGVVPPPCPPLVVELTSNGQGSPHSSSLPPKGWLRLTVSDTGHGMTPAVRERIFEAFFTTKERGTGLGLAVVRQLVENFGGFIEVRSELQQGTRFDIWLPARNDETGA